MTMVKKIMLFFGVAMTLDSRVYMASQNTVFLTAVNNTSSLTWRRRFKCHKGSQSLDRLSYLPLSGDSVP